MPQTTLEWRRDASPDELAARAKEMRSEWAELATKDRESDEYTRAKDQFFAERDDLDVMLSLHAMEGRMPASLRSTGGVPDGVRGGAQVETRSAGQQVVENEQFAAWTKAGARGDSPAVELRALDTGLPAGTVGVADTHGSSALLPVGQPYLANVHLRKVFVRDLMTVQSTTLGSIPYVREVNALANAGVTDNTKGAKTVKESFTKPDMLFEFVPDNAPVKVIAGSVTVTRQIVEDSTTLMGYINNQIPYRVKIREEDQILSGDPAITTGGQDNLKGILKYSGIQTTGAVSGATGTRGDAPVILGNAIAKIELVDGFADGVVMNPADYWPMMTKRVGGSVAGDGPLDLGFGAFTQSPVQYVWGLPIVRTNGCPTGEAIVANWRMGATLFDRSPASVRVFEQHSDYPARNLVFLLGEERIALAVNREDYFCVAPLVAP